MGRNFALGCTLALVLASVLASPSPSTGPFARYAVETIPRHDPIAQPIRASVESVPHRTIRDESGGRLPLRDAVEKRPIPFHDENYSFKTVKPDFLNEESALKHYYGAALHLNNGTRNDERLQLGNANLQAMQQTSSSLTRRLVVCYMQSWAAYRAPPLAFTAGLVPKSCTHLHYAFATMHPHTYAIIPTNEDYDVIKGGYRITTGLKRRIPGLKIMISIGGEGTDRLFSEMVQEPQRRNLFIESAIRFLQDHDFDGLDLHWVYPGEKDDKEKESLTRLLYEIREKFSTYGYLLSAILPPFRYQIEDGFDLSAVSGATDYTVLQAWDMTHGKRDEPPSRAVQHSTLHRDPGATSRDQRYDNIEFMVKYILRNGMAAEKLVLGIPLFGRSYTLAPSTLPSPGATVSGWGDEGTYTQTKGMLSYFEICMAEREGKGVSGIDEAGNAYAVFDNQWVTYDTPSTVLEKMKFVITSGLAGAAAWSVDLDDFRGLCGTPFPLLSTISSTLNAETGITDHSSLKIGSCNSDFPYLESDEQSCSHYHFCSGGISYRMTCEDERLYDPSTGFCGHQDVAKCMPGQSLRISIEDAARYLSQVYENDFEWNDTPVKEMPMRREPERLVQVVDSKKSRINDKKVICYMTSWAFYRRGGSKFVPENVDTRLCSHVVYAYASLSPDDLITKEFDPWTDITNNMYERVTSLKDVKVLLALGGWTDSAGDKYSRLVSSASARSKFIQKLIPFLRMHNFDGLHLDWNYPVCWQSNCKKGAMSDKPNFAMFIQELGKGIHAAGMELGVAISGYKEIIESAYDLPVISREADFMSVMTYDYHGGWERKTAHHTPLIPTPTDSLSYYSIEYAVKTLISSGADPKKLLLGLSFYGQSYRLAEADGTKGPGSLAAGPGEPGEFTKQPGMLAYYEICYRVKHLRWKTGRQDNAGPYAYSDNQWVGYDDPKSITEKVEWAMKQGLGGVMAWAMDLDDFTNRCCGEPSPLLRAAGRALGRSVPAPPTGTCERPPEPITPQPPTTTPAESDGSMVGAGAGGDHNHGAHDQTSTTWPSWSPSTTASTTAQTWWPPAVTSTTTTTTTRRPTPTTTTTTRRPSPTTTTKRPTSGSGSIEGDSCIAGEYHAAAGDCEGYLQCEAGHWRKHNCAPGLHWAAAVQRCDWPSFAKCTTTPSSEASTATTTLAPMTSRPPPRPTTTTRRTTTSTTTTTRPTRPITSGTPTGPSEGASCNGQEYQPVQGDCNSYLHCDGSIWRLQHCAPGLHWSNNQKHCDWPKYARCEESEAATSAPQPKPTTTTTTRRPSTIKQPSDKEEDGECGGNDMHAPASTCDSYLLCVGGRWRKQMCPPALHWDKRTSRCDWAEFAMCDTKPSATKSPMPQPTMSTTTARTTTRATRPTRPMTTTTQRPSQDEISKPDKNCVTGTYHAHPKCEKFYICVNGIMIAQNCAPGLVWRQDRSQCDFPSATSCTDRRQGVSAPLIDASNDAGALDLLEEERPKYCNSGEYIAMKHDCTRYQHCIFGKLQEFACSDGLFWNQDKNICDWPKNVKCKKINKVTTTTTVRPTVIMEVIPDIDSMKNDDIQAISTATQPEVSSTPSLKDSRYKLVCYYTNWSWYRPGIGKFTPEDIDPSLCTHIVYGFAVLSDDGLIMAHDSWADFDNRFYERVVQYKRHGIKVSLGLGGWNDSAGDKYSKLVNDPAARARFITNVIDFLDMYKFDGLDLDWEYPKCWQVDCSKGPDSDKQAFSDWVRELSAVMKPKGLLLSSAVSPSKMVIDAAYDVPALARHLDWIAVMTYDYHGQWDQKTGHVAPLYYHPSDDNTYFNANYTMHYWITKGAPPSKLVMGMPMYGQTFTLKDQIYLRVRSQGAGLNLPAVTGGEEGEYTRAKGFLAYYEICDRIKFSGWTAVKDPMKRMGPYAYKDNQWVSFDDTEIIKEKVKLIKSLGLAGGMVWSMDLDDHKNRCGDGKYPLLNAIKNNLLGMSSMPSKPSQTVNNNIGSDPEFESMNVEFEDDLDDIEVRPSYKPTSAKPAVTQADEDEDIMITTKKPTTLSTTNMDERYKVVCYYTNWAWYRPGSGKYTPSEIDPSLCTHIVYAFAVLDSIRLVMKPHDIWLDVENKFYEKVVSLKSQGVKVVLGLGGWDDSASDKYSRLVNSASARRKFIVHAIDFIEQYEFDGLDLDWQYPRCWQVNCAKGPSTDKQGFASLVKELREALNSRGLLLSAAVSAIQKVIDVAYDVPTLNANLNWIALMTYDYHGQWEKVTGHVAPMYASAYDGDTTLNTNYSVNYWINRGAEKEKLILGVPFYGQSFSLVENAGHGLGAPTYAGGEAGDETRARGFLSYYEICDRVRMQGWKVSRDPGGRMGPYAFLEDQWVSFDDDYMVRHKSEYVREMGLGGAMAWALDLDDFTGKYCGCGKSPLLNTINHVLRNKEAPPSCQLEEIQAPGMESPEIQPEVTTEMTIAPQVPSSSPEPTDDETGVITTGNLEGTKCFGNMFRNDNTDCSKYYLCINGEFLRLSCPEPLHWNKNHCDFPEKAQCQSRAQLRLPGFDIEETIEIDKPIVACYFTSWSYYRQGIGSFGPEKVNPLLCTHIIYSWAHIDPKTFMVVPGIPELDVENNFFDKIMDLRQSGAKIILGIGGLKDSEDGKWITMTHHSKNRKIFIESIIKFLQKWKFDGVQIAWQYPVCKQTPCTEPNRYALSREDFNNLILEISHSLRPLDLELSAMVASSPIIAELAYDPNILTAELDWVAIAANDYISSIGRTSYLASLESTNVIGTHSINATLNYWASVMSPKKLVMNVPAYGQSYTLRSSSNPGLGAPISGLGESGPFTQVPGFLAYYEICAGLGSKEWKETQSSDGTFAVNGKQWASYLKPEEVHKIAASASLAGYRGVGLWALDLDDWRGDCSCWPSPLLTALREGLLDPKIPPSFCAKHV